MRADTCNGDGVEISRKQRQITWLIAVILLAGTAANLLINYSSSRDRVRQDIIEQGLPLTGDNIYSEISKDVVRPILVSSLMAHDTFVRDWIVGGEQSATPIARYLSEIRNRYHTSSSFVVSRATLRYYAPGGIARQVNPEAPMDRWFTEALYSPHDYVLNIDTDQQNGNKLTAFVNYKAYDYNKRVIAVVGVGLTVEGVREKIDHYETRFERGISLVNGKGQVILHGKRSKGGNVQDDPALAPIANQILRNTGQPQIFFVQRQNHNIILSVRYLSDLGWYLLVEQDETAELDKTRKAMMQSLLVSGLMAVAVIGLILLINHRGSRDLARLATTDQLTGCANRHAFQETWARQTRSARQRNSTMALVMLDIDHFKQVNDKLGHVAGDHVLVAVASLLRQQARSSDSLVRWGGEEFVMLVAGAEREALASHLDGLRQLIAATPLQAGGEQVQVTVSMGVTLFPAGQGLDDVVAQADAALYRAKQNGRNSVVFHVADAGPARAVLA